jgi:protein SCO1/2
MLVALLFSLASTSDPADRLAVIRPAPAFELRDQNDRPVKMSDYRGKVVLVSFIFTTCNGTCPATTHRMARLNQELARRSELKDHVQFVSISLDPKRDTPETLRGYMRLYDIDGGNWTFLTGAPKAVEPVLASWGMWARPAANGQLDHPSRVYLVDRQGDIREIYNLDFFRYPWIMEDIRLLVSEKKR